MKASLAIICSLALGIVGFAEELSPDIARLAAAHRESSQNLETQHTSQVATNKQAYLTALVAADKAATTAGNAGALTAITKERENVEKSTVAGDPPAALPKTVLGPRRTFIKANERATADYAQQKKTVDGVFLRGLAGLELKAASDPKLAGQILDQKKRLLSGRSGPVIDLSAAISDSHWANVKDPKDVWHFDAGGKLNGNWPYKATKDSVAVWWTPSYSITYTLAKDGLTLMEGTTPKYQFVSQKDK